MNYEHITVVSISGNGDGSNALPSILKSMKELPGSIGLLLSIEMPKNIPNDILWRKIPELNYVQYSMFVIHFLKSFIHTEFALIVQEDGWVLSGKNWDDRYLNYDYIGAPCHSAYVNGMLVNKFKWIGASNAVIVQNGGLSLRSKKLLNELSNYSNFYDFSRQQPESNEDVLITGLHSEFLKVKGFKFAPIEVAKFFSVEFFAPGLHDDVEISKVFGVHGNIRKLINEDTVRYTIPLEVLNNMIFREREIYNFFINKNFCVRTQELIK